jgi:hypothetical protein
MAIRIRRRELIAMPGGTAVAARARRAQLPAKSEQRVRRQEEKAG